MNLHSRKRFALTGLVLISLWPLWHWLIRRSYEYRERPEQWLAVLAILLFFLFREGIPATVKKNGLWLSGSFILLFHLSLWRIPMIFSGVIAMAALSCALSALYLNRYFHLGVFGILCCTFRTIPSLINFAGYPLRVIATTLSAIVLNIGQMDVTQAGTSLIYNNSTVFVDGPCSGISMLWTGMFLTLTLSLIYRLDNKGVAGASLLGAIALILGNVLRICGIFLYETIPVLRVQWFHDLAGLTAYGITTVLILKLIKNLSAEANQRKGKTPVRNLQQKSMAFVIVFAIGIPLFTYRPLLQGLNVQNNKIEVQWPEYFEGKKLFSEELSPHEETSLADFPGNVGRFYTDNQHLTIFLVNEPTRMLHSRALCLEAAGFTVEHLPEYEDEDGRRWCQIQVSKTVGNTRTRLRFREITIDSQGRHFSDLSTWYWAIFTRQTTGPWIHYAVEEDER